MLIGAQLMGFSRGGCILDTLSAVLPKAVYSLARLTASYSGKCINVRRDSDNSAIDIGFSGNQLDITTLIFFVGSANGYVTKWYNQGSAGANGNLIQSTAAAQPAIVLAGVLQSFNNCPAVYFSQSSTRQNMASSGNVTYNSGGAWSTNFVTSLVNTSNDTNAMYALNPLSSTGGVFVGPTHVRVTYSSTTRLPNYIQYFYVNNSGTGSSTSQSFDVAKLASPFIHTSIQTLSGSTLSAVNYINSDSQSITVSTAAGSPPASGPVLLGQGGTFLGLGFSGYVGSLIVFDGAISSTDANILINYQKSYFGISA